MASIEVTRRFEIDAGHRVLNHESVCAHPHGHRYGIVVTAIPKDDEGLDDLGRVIDFGVIKEILGRWLTENWDHAFLVDERDEVMRGFLEAQNFRRYVLPCNPTAENLAEHLVSVICPKLFGESRVLITKVDVHETPNCVATATR